MTESPVTLLLVDDREENLLALEVTLRHPKYHLVKALSGTEALEQLAHCDPALILLDVQMPGMDGFETARRIKRNPRWRDIPIVFITAISKDPVHVFEGYESGGIDYLTKPFDDQLLRSKVAVIVELVSKRRQIQQQQRELVQANAQLQKEIWDRQLVEEALRRARDELERRVQERTAALSAANEALRTEILERRRAEEQTQSSLHEKEILLREIHHRVKNNLQVVSSLLDLQAGYIQDPIALVMFRNSQNRVKSMALVHEKLYQSRDLSRIHMRGYLEGLVEEIWRANSVSPSVKIRVLADEVLLAIDQAIPCALIANELVTNALEHAFTPGQTGEIAVTLSAPAEGRCRLEVRDNGRGLPPGTDFRATETLGLTLVNALTEQLHGTLELDSAPGTAFTLAFSLAKDAAPTYALEDSHR